MVISIEILFSYAYMNFFGSAQASPQISSCTQTHTHKDEMPSHHHHHYRQQSMHCVERRTTQRTARSTILLSANFRRLCMTRWCLLPQFVSCQKLINLFCILVENFTVCVCVSGIISVWWNVTAHLFEQKFNYPRMHIRRG